MEGRIFGPIRPIQRDLTMTLRPFARLAAVALAAAGMAAATASAQAQTPRVLALITSGDVQTQGMAFVLLGQMRQQGATVEVLLCGPAADMARREPPAATPLRPMNATPAQMLRNMVAAGVRAEVCALYLPNAGITAEGLAEGVRPAAPPEVARRMLAEGTRVMPF
jgi:predicted peroxiredoxin